MMLKGQARPFVSNAGAKQATRVVRPNVRANAASSPEGFQTMRAGVKVAADETVLSPRFYTTDFDEMDNMFNLKNNPSLRMDELESCLQEFKMDYNQKHFVRNDTFKPAAEKITGPTRRIFVEFLERSCTAEFSGFLLYKELGRRMKTTNPVVAEIFTLLSRDEARHAGFINKALADFNLALDLGFLTKNRTYTFFQPKFILYTTYLSEKIGYWRYISIYRHLLENPDNQLYPLFEYFENWCQDENRHGDFLAAMLKAHPYLLKGTVAELWCHFFCLTVYITMYLNDHSRAPFYEALGLNTTEFNKHVIIETNKSAGRLFPVIPDCEAPWFFTIMDKVLALSQQLATIDKSDAPGFLKALQKAPVYERMVANIAQLLCAKPVKAGSADLAENQTAVQY
jgi:magnesium-protoporphyrin IX monomethyl ester (oxidative) cyclase